MSLHSLDFIVLLDGHGSHTALLSQLFGRRRHSTVYNSCCGQKSQTDWTSFWPLALLQWPQKWRETHTLLLVFHFLDNGLWSTEVFNFDEVQFICFFLGICGLGVVLRNHFSNPRSQRLTLKFSLKCFSFALSSVWSSLLCRLWGWGCSFLLSHVDSQLSQRHLLQRPPSPFEWPWPFCQKINWPSMYGFIGLFLDFPF